MGKLSPPPERDVLHFLAEAYMPWVVDSSFQKVSHREVVPLCEWLVPMVRTTHRHPNMTRHGWEVKRTGPCPAEPCSPPTSLLNCFRRSYPALQTSHLM